MPQTLVHRPENWKFSHAAAAMGAFWARARKVEARRKDRTPERQHARSRAVAVAATDASAALQQH